MTNQDNANINCWVSIAFCSFHGDLPLSFWTVNQAEDVFYKWGQAVSKNRDGFIYSSLGLLQRVN